LLPALRRKPGAFARWVLRDEMFPRNEYRRIWERLQEGLSERQACKTMVGLLDLAARGACEADLAQVLADCCKPVPCRTCPAWRNASHPGWPNCPKSRSSFRPGGLRHAAAGGGMSALEAATLPMLLTELRLPTIKRLWPALAEQSNREGWPAERFLTALLEHEMNERETRRIDRHRVESLLPPDKRLSCFDFAAVPTGFQGPRDGVGRGR